MYKSILTLMLVVMCSFQDATMSNTDSQVMKIADSQMSACLARIEPGNEGLFGFTPQDDLNACIVGKPYRIIEFNSDFYNNALDENANYFSIKNKWLVPVSLNHQYKTFLTVQGNPGNLNVSGMGSISLAKELQLLSLSTNESDEFYILKIPKLKADFFVHETNNSLINAVFIPLESATIAIPVLGNKENYSLTEIEKIIKSALLKTN